MATQNLLPGLSLLAAAQAQTESAEIIVKYHGELSGIAARLDALAEPLGGGFAILTLPVGNIGGLYRFKEIEYAELPKTLFPSLLESARAACVPPVWAGQAGQTGLTGRDVLVGIIDSGIAFSHPAFLDGNGQSRVVYLWDQTANGTPPDGFLHGAEYTRGQINSALAGSPPDGMDPDMDFLGHGTAVAGIAAGGGNGGGTRGIAPEAELIAVKLGGDRRFARTTGMMRALHYITIRAEELGKPVAINLSFGTNDGSHEGNSLFEAYVNEVCGRWKSVIVTGTGNEGFARHHYSGAVLSGGVTDVRFTVGPSVYSCYLTLWKNFADDFEFELFAPSGSSAGVFNPADPFRQTVLEGVSLAVFYGQPSFYNESQEFYIGFSRQDLPVTRGVWTLRVSGRQSVDGRFEAWLHTLEEVGFGTAFLEPSPFFTLTLPSTTENVLSVGGYNAATDSAADFSGRGRAVENGVTKPDLTAPAVEITAPSNRGGTDVFSGTSIAAPFVTGAVALMMEWGIVRGNDPFLYGQRVKAFLRRGALRRPGIGYPDPVWGYGTLCLQKTMEILEGGDYEPGVSQNSFSADALH
ncbi:MAG: S8 family serine peptidase [Oscillospiraceae bacterium]|jgi:subtilisin family serine protease|nr:S8 family serine peptidase [Oscillospiraceae bacterium]